jgi:ADP-heptose:LPS heptosyltransferase
MIPANFRIGFGNGIFPWKKKNPWSHFFDVRIDSRENSVHESDINLLPLKFLNLPRPESAHLKLAPVEQPSSYPLPPRYVVIGVGASRREKIYPAEKLAAALQLVRAQIKLPMVITGLGTEFYPAHPEEIDARGRLNLPQLAQVIKGAALFIGMDSGPLHMASAFDVPTVLLSGASPGLAAFDPHSPQRFGPKATCQKIILNENNRGTQLSFEGVEPSRVAEQILNFYAKEFQACQKSV